MKPIDHLLNEAEREADQILSSTPQAHRFHRYALDALKLVEQARRAETPERELIREIEERVFWLSHLLSRPLSSM